MELIERAEFLTQLQTHYKTIAEGEGHCIFVSGEAGIGKTSLVKAFCKENKGECNIYQGTCDALFTPRPLAPLFDIMWQVSSQLWPNTHSIEERGELFAEFFRELSMQRKRCLIIFEDIHWADEATLDFIKFFARRITHLRCLFILTYRDEEVHEDHPLKNILGQLPPDSFSRMRLTPLSRQAVEKMAQEKGYNGEDVYVVSGGNPFYVNEILASYNMGVPESIKDSILSTYNRQEGKTKQIWDLLSVVPSSFEAKYLEILEPFYAGAIDRCMQSKIIFLDNGLVFFKHELFRRTIEAFLSPLKRIMLNKKILDLFRESFEQNHEIERIIHHAKNANVYETVVHYCPIAARQAASVGAHIEASKLYLSAIEYYQGNDKDLLIQFYEPYAYECYLTNKIKEAIIYTRKSLEIWTEKNDIEKTGNCMRFLSRLWWLDGNRINAEKFAAQAIDLLNSQPSSPSKAMAFSNMSQLKMLSDHAYECISWGEKAIAIASEINDEETLSHALNNVGTVQMNITSAKKTGIDKLQQSLKIALKNSYHEHAARAYSNLASNGMMLKNFVFVQNILEEGIQYCDERDLDSWRTNMLSVKASLLFETGNWKEAIAIADSLLRTETQFPSFTAVALMISASVKMRRGDADALPLLFRAKEMAFKTMELQSIIPVMSRFLEYEWMTGKTYLETGDLELIIAKSEESIYNIQNNEFSFWLLKARNQNLSIKDVYEGYETSSIKKVQQSAAFWEKLGCPYAQAVALSEGNEDDKRKAIAIILELDATLVYEKMKLEMKTAGIKKIPRGIRKTTRANSALLTGREMEILLLLHEGLQNKEIATTLFISAKTVDHHISAILFKLEVNTRTKAVKEAVCRGIIKSE